MYSRGTAQNVYTSFVHCVLCTNDVDMSEGRAGSLKRQMFMTQLFGKSKRSATRSNEER